MGHEVTAQIQERWCGLDGEAVITEKKLLLSTQTPIYKPKSIVVVEQEP